MIALIENVLLGLAMVSFAAMIRLFCRHRRLHRRRANKQFMAGYKAAYHRAGRESGRGRHAA